jgi:CBS domain-containing protein
MVHSVMQEALVIVDPADTLDIAEALMFLADSRHIPVVRDGRLVGIISARDVLRWQAQGIANPHAREVMSEPAVTIGPYESIHVAARRMLDHHISSLPVVDEDECLLGMVTSTDLLRAAVDELRETVDAGGDSLVVAKLMTPAPLLTVTPEEGLDVMELLMKQRPCRHLPVVEDRRVIGMVSDRDLLQSGTPPPKNAREVMTRRPRTVPPTLPAAEAGSILLAEHFGALPVVREGALVGIVTEVDYMAWLA